MKKSTVSLLIILTLMAVLLGFNYFKRPFAKSDQAALTATPVPDVSPSPTAEVPVSGTPEDKIAKLIAYPLVIPKIASASGVIAADPTDLAWISQYHPAIVTLFGTKISTQSAQIVISQIKAQYPSDQPPLIAVDHEGGTTQRLNGTGFTVLPSWQTLCTQSATASAQILTQSLSEVKAVGVNIVLAPVVDVAAHNPALGTRVCSGEATTVIDRAGQYAQIATDLHLLPIFKHFPGIGASHLDLHQSFDRVTVTPTDASVYKDLLDRFPTAGVMVSHIGVINQFPDKPCSLSPDCVSELATTYPQTLIMTDALDMKAASYVPPTQYPNSSISAIPNAPLTLPQVSEGAVRAGDQILLFSQAVTPAQLTEVIQQLVPIYNQDQTFQSQIDQAVTHVQAARQSLLGAQ